MDRNALERAWDAKQDEDGADGVAVDPLLPPFHHLVDGSRVTAVLEAAGAPITAPSTFTKSQITIVATLDRTNPLTEARWVKTGEIEPWILSLGIASGLDVKADMISEWRGKITVADPDPVRLSCVDLGRLECLIRSVSRQQSSMHSSHGRRARLQVLWKSGKGSSPTICRTWTMVSLASLQPSTGRGFGRFFETFACPLFASV